MWTLYDATAFCKLGFSKYFLGLLSLVLSLSACGIIVTAGTPIKTNSTGDNESTIWDKLFSDEVPFPGSTWLKFVAMDEPVLYSKSNPANFFSSPYEAILDGAPGDHLVKNFNCFINSLVFSSDFATKILATFGVSFGHYVLCYLRNLFAGMIVYYGTAGIFHYFCYIHPMSKEIFKDRVRPSNEIIWDQIQLAQSSLFIYVALPVLSDYLVEEGFTKAYYSLDDIGGWHYYAFFMVLYMAFVEIGIYWMHRTLHTNKFLYKHIHLLHHKYKTAEMLTPWASIAFNPIDGILQASPYVVCLFIVPCHYFTHVGLVFFTAVWATYIHDAMDWNIDPIMGSKYHTVHHTHYMYNFGQMFTFCDAFWGTLRVPTEKTGLIKSTENRKLD